MIDSHDLAVWLRLQDLNKQFDHISGNNRSKNKQLHRTRDCGSLEAEQWESFRSVLAPEACFRAATDIMGFDCDQGSRASDR